MGKYKYLPPCLLYLIVTKDPSKVNTWAALVAQRFSTAYSSGRDPGDPGSSPTSGSLHGALFSLCLCLCLSLSLSLNE